VVAASVVIITGLLAWTAIVAPLIYTHTEAPTQFLQHVRHHFTTTTWAEGMATSLMLGRSQFVMLLAWALVGPATLMTCLRMGRGREWLRLWAGPLGGAVFLLAAQPGNFTYYWFLAPWLLAAVLGTAVWLPDAPVRLLVVTLTGGVYLATLVPALQDEGMLLTLPPGQGIEDGAATARRLVPPGSRVWCNSAWYALAEDRVVFDFWLDLTSVSAVDYVVVAGTGWGDPEAGNLITAGRRELIEQNFDLIWDGLLQREGWLPTHHGTMFPDEGYGFGVRVYRAKRLAEASRPSRASGAPDESEPVPETSRLP
jgi:hypothetical protein